jgi:hypothetical protein
MGRSIAFKLFDKMITVVLYKTDTSRGCGFLISVYHLITKQIVLSCILLFLYHHCTTAITYGASFFIT